MEHLPIGVQIAGRPSRLLAFVWDALLAIAFSVIWLIWSAAFTWRLGQTPGKRVIRRGIRVVDTAEWTAAGSSVMFWREVARAGIVVVSLFTLFIPLLWVFWDRNRQAPWDRLLGTIVVSDPEGLVNIAG